MSALSRTIQNSGQMFLGTITFALIRTAKNAARSRHTSARPILAPTYRPVDLNLIASCVQASSLVPRFPRARNSRRKRHRNAVCSLCLTKVTFPKGSNLFKNVCSLLLIFFIVLAAQQTRNSLFPLLLVWVNNTDFIFGKNPKPGFDPIIGQAPGAGVRDVTGTNSKDAKASLKLPTDWVISKGGEYFFSPSLPALKTKFAKTTA